VALPSQLPGGDQVRDAGADHAHSLCRHHRRRRAMTMTLPDTQA
jgi:hypothetical protein